MPNKISALLVSFCVIFLLYLFCSSPVNPFDKDTTALNITLKNSNGIDTTAITFTGTIGDTIHIGVSTYLYDNIDSVTICVFTQTTKADTSFTLKKFVGDLDTIWRSVVFSSSGIRIIKTTLFINNGNIKKYENSVSVILRPIKWLHDIITIETSEGTLYQLNLADSITNANGNSVTMSLLPTSLSGNSIVGKTWKYLAGYSDSGSHIVKILADDGLTRDTLTVLLHVKNVNRKPVFETGKPLPDYKINGGDSLSFAISATDADSDAVSYFVKSTTLPHASPVLNGTTITWRGQLTDSMNATIVIGAKDYKDTTFDTVRVVVSPTFSPPVISILNQTKNANLQIVKGQRLIIHENDTLKLFVQASDVDIGQTVVKSLADKSKFIKGIVQWDSITGVFSYIPDYNAVINTDSMEISGIRFLAKDNGTPSLSDTFSLNICVINVNRLPIPVSQTVSTGRNSAKTIVLTATDQDGDSIVSWAIDKLPVNGLYLISPTFPNITYTPNTGFIGRDSLVFKANDDKGWSTISGVITIIVDSAKVAPVITTDIRLDTTANQGATVTFSVVTNNSFPSPVFAWFKKDSLKSIASTQFFTLTNVTIKDTGNYYVIVTNNAGADTSLVGHLKVNVPPVIITQPSPLIKCIGDADSFTVAASGTPPLAYQWKKGTTIVGTNQNVYRIASVSKSDTGTYTCVVTNSAGSITTNAATLALNMYTVKFNCNGGSSVDSQKVFCNTNAAAPITPTKQSYTFVGWYTDSVLLKNSFSFTSAITGNISLFAKWEIRDVDGNVYSEVKIGSQVWMVENFRSTKYNDGTAIPLDTNYSTWTNLTTPAYCYYNNTTNTDSIRKFGALYNWYAAAGTGKLAPAGWHVPSDSEWDTLQNYLIVNGYNYDGSTTGNLIAKSMAAKTDWNTSTNSGAPGNNETLNNSSGFSAIPGGYRLTNNYSRTNFNSIGFCGYWWSATATNALNSFEYNIFNSGSNLSRGADDKAGGFSVKLVKNN